MKRLFILLFGLLTILSSCAVVRQGEVGVKRTIGKIQEKPLMEGARVYNPFVSTIIKLPVRTMNMELKSPLPSKEGLTVQSEVSILYRLVGDYAPSIVEKLGTNYEEVVIVPVFRSAVADVSSQYFAKDLHTGQRSVIERDIQKLMESQLKDRGFIIEAEGIRDAQKIISEGLSPLLLRFKTIEAFNKLSTSPNAKVIITNGEQPLMINGEN